MDRFHGVPLRAPRMLRRLPPLAVIALVLLTSGSALAQVDEQSELDDSVDPEQRRGKR